MMQRNHDHTIGVFRELRSHLTGPPSDRVAVIVLAEAGEPVSMGDLALRIGMSPAATSMIGKRLVRDGLAMRDHGGQDLRTVRLALTKAGARAVEKATRSAS